MAIVVIAEIPCIYLVGTYCTIAAYLPGQAGKEHPAVGSVYIHTNYLLCNNTCGCMWLDTWVCSYIVPSKLE